jgi:hypothetical protein
VEDAQPNKVKKAGPASAKPDQGDVVRMLTVFF